MGFFNRKKQPTPPQGSNPFRMPYGEPPARAAKEWIAMFNNSPRLNPVHQIASDVATSVYGVFVDGNDKKMEADPLAMLLKRPSPEPTMTEYFLFYITEVYLLLPMGEAFWIKERDGAGRVTQLWPVPPTWVTNTPSSGNGYYEVRPPYAAGGTQVPSFDMVYFKRPNVGSPYGRGMGRTSGIGDEVETDEYMAKAEKRFFFNNGVPDMVGMMPGADPIAVHRQELKWHEKFGGYGNQNRTAWLNWDAKFQILRSTEREMEYVNSRKFLRDAANQHFCIPPELFGILENSNRSTIDAAYYLYTKNVLRKELKFLDDTINRQLADDFPGTRFLLHDNVVPEDIEFILKKANEGLKNGGITIDEWRNANGWDDLPNGAGRVRMYPLNMIVVPENVGIPKPPETPKPVEPPKIPKATKAIDDRKMLVWQIFDKTAKSNESMFERVMIQHFERERRTILDSYKSKVKTSAEVPMDWIEEDELLLVQLKPLWLETLLAGFEMANDTYGLGVGFDVVNPHFRDWVDSIGLTKAKGINETTSQLLRETLSEGIMEGDDIEKLRDRIKDVFEGCSDYRATLIARTETTATVNAGALTTYRGAGVKKKEWLETDDDRTRPEHRHMPEGVGGEIVGIDEAFSNGLDSPGEPNCRCTVLPVLEEV